LFEPVGRDAFGLFSLEEKVVREAIHGLKYDGISELADSLIGVLKLSCEPHALVRSLGITNGVVVPVPISSARLRRRGYNQAELLAVALGQWLEMPVSNMLQRGGGKTLVGASRIERQRRVIGAFKVDLRAEMKGRSFVLVDDVVTTGSTLAACRMALLEAGAEKVVCVAFGYRHRGGELA
jgi:ComF family protein